MRSKLIAPGILALALGLAACGSSGTKSSHSHRSSLGARPLQVYRVALSGATTPAGARDGRGAAVIAIHRGARVCWRFAHLHGFSQATTAQIHRGPAGKTGSSVLVLSTGPKLSHQGCVRSTATLVSAIEQSPPAYYVVIDSAGYPNGAVRAQL